MLRRCLPPVAAAALAVCTITAMAAPARHAPAPGPRTVPVAVEGTAAAWDAGAGTLALSDAVALRGPRVAKRAVAGAARVRVVTTPATVLIGEDDEGYRERIAPEVLFDELDGADADVVVAVSGRLAVPTAKRARSGRPVLTAAKVIVHLPPTDADDPYGDDIDGLPAEGPVDDEPVIDPDDPDVTG